MGIPDRSALVSKIKRVPEKLNIHNLFIFNKSGICIYGLNLTNLYPIEQEQLISSYFTALMSFTKELIGDKIKTVEMGGGIKLVVFEKKSLYYSLLCSTIENLELLEAIISKINLKFLEYANKNKIRTDLEYVYDEQLNYLIEDIIREPFSSEFDLKKEAVITGFLNDFQRSADLSGAILLTNRGKVIFSSFNDTSLKRFLTEVDFRVKISNNSILKLFYTSKNNELIFSENIRDTYILILIFDTKIKFGMAEFYLQKAVKKIMDVLNK
ncbi:MAG: hypothetical protein KGD70_02270 [Candidatus Lokiarchaeota archaeon]|nr:hypothetical protein [Candidatus Lokiarchaeota archaeon]